MCFFSNLWMSVKSVFFFSLRIRELEMELGAIQGQTSESSKAYQRTERRVKELQFQQDEDKKNQDRYG
jgi:hypothetical protein